MRVNESGNFVQASFWRLVGRCPLCRNRWLYDLLSPLSCVQSVVWFGVSQPCGLLFIFRSLYQRLTVNFNKSCGLCLVHVVFIPAAVAIRPSDTAIVTRWWLSSACADVQYVKIKLCFTCLSCTLIAYISFPFFVLVESTLSFIRLNKAFGFFCDIVIHSYWSENSFCL